MEKKSGLLGRLDVKAFTLIELLVVVLIIGILAAVALPQYQKAVEKAHMTEALSAVDAIAKAQEIYYLANGDWATDLNDLTIDLPLEDTSYGAIPAKQSTYWVFAARNFSENRSFIALAQSRRGGLVVMGITISKQRYCVTYTGTSNSTSPVQRKICEEWADVVQTVNL